MFNIFYEFQPFLETERGVEKQVVVLHVGTKIYVLSQKL